MSKAFREAFPTLKLEEELEGLLDTTEVTKISANHEHTHIRIYLRAKRLIFKKNIWKLEKAITEQIFQNRAIQVKIIESYELSEQYTPKSLIEVYKDSILDELNAYSVLEYNLLRTADMEIPGEDRLIFLFLFHLMFNEPDKIIPVHQFLGTDIQGFAFISSVYKYCFIGI